MLFENFNSLYLVFLFATLKGFLTQCLKCSYRKLLRLKNGQTSQTLENQLNFSCLASTPLDHDFAKLGKVRKRGCLKPCGGKQSYAKDVFMNLSLAHCAFGMLSA